MNHHLPPHPAIEAVPPFAVTPCTDGGREVTVELAPADAAALQQVAVPLRSLARAAQHALGLAGVGSRIHDDEQGITVFAPVPLHLRGRAALWLVACTAPAVLLAFLQAAGA